MGDTVEALRSERGDALSMRPSLCRATRREFLQWSGLVLASLGGVTVLCHPQRAIGCEDASDDLNRQPAIGERVVVVSKLPGGTGKSLLAQTADFQALAEDGLARSVRLAPGFARYGGRMEWSMAGGRAGIRCVCSRPASQQPATLTCFPATFYGQQLAAVAQVIRLGSRTGVYCLTPGGVDPCVDSRLTSQRKVSEFAAAVRRFYRELACLGQGDRVLTVAVERGDSGSVGHVHLFSPALQAGVLNDPCAIDGFDGLCRVVRDRWLGAA